MVNELLKKEATLLSVKSTTEELLRNHAGAPGVKDVERQMRRLGKSSEVMNYVLYEQPLFSWDQHDL